MTSVILSLSNSNKINPNSNPLNLRSYPLFMTAKTCSTMTAHLTSTDMNSKKKCYQMRLIRQFSPSAAKCPPPNFKSLVSNCNPLFYCLAPKISNPQFSKDVSIQGDDLIFSRAFSAQGGLTSDIRPKVS